MDLLLLLDLDAMQTLLSSQEETGNSPKFQFGQYPLIKEKHIVMMNKAYYTATIMILTNIPSGLKSHNRFSTQFLQITH
jgi:hypothetical protein